MPEKRNVAKSKRQRRDLAAVIEKGRDWMVQVEEGRKTTSQLAQEEDVSLRTVQRSIQHARRGGGIGAAREQLLAKALEAHYHDLARQAERLEGWVQNAFPGPMGLRQVDRDLMEALRGHIPLSPLWECLARLEEMTKYLDKKEIALRDSIEKKVMTGTDQFGYAAIYNRTGLTDYLTAAVFSFIMARARQKNAPTQIEFRVQDEENEKVLFYMNSRLARVPVDKLTAAEEFCQGLFREAERLPICKELERLEEKAREPRELARRELVKVKFRRFLPGKCYLCPDQGF